MAGHLVSKNSNLDVKVYNRSIEKSEKIVVIGGYKEEQFVVDQVILKCPSKYEETEIKEEEYEY